MFEVLWDTKQFSDLDWPTDGSNPFVWSFGDATGYANHADYVFGWKDNSLQKVLDSPCYFYTNCSEYGHKLQSVDDMNKCSQKTVVDENIDGCKWSASASFAVIKKPDQVTQGLMLYQEATILSTARPPPRTFL